MVEKIKNPVQIYYLRFTSVLGSILPSSNTSQAENEAKEYPNNVKGGV